MSSHCSSDFRHPSAAALRSFPPMCNLGFPKLGIFIEEKVLTVSGESPGRYARLRYPTIEDAEAAIDQYDLYLLNGRRLSLRFCSVLDQETYLTVCVRNVSRATTSDHELGMVFALAGEVTNIALGRNRAFVRFNTRAAVVRAVSILDGIIIAGMAINVQNAQYRPSIFPVTLPDANGSGNMSFSGPNHQGFGFLLPAAPAAAASSSAPALNVDLDCGAGSSFWSQQFPPFDRN